MYLKDFEYDGEKLSERNYMLCTFSGVDEVFDISNNINIEKVKPSHKNEYWSVGYSYDDVFSIELSICKDTCNMDNYTSLTDEEINDVLRWLNRKKYCKFKPIYNDNSFSNVYYFGTFNIKLVKYGDDVVGFNLTLSTNAPYGFMEDVVEEHILYAEQEFNFIDISDEIGHINCDLVIKCNESGNYRITNSNDENNAVVINNCQAGEIITILGKEEIITSTFNHPTLPNDFNYNYFRVVNTYKNRENIFKVNLGCELQFKYNPIRKVGIVI